MFFLFSGEGVTDLGTCARLATPCKGDDYQPGPMAIIVDQIVAARHGYSLLEVGCCGFVSRRILGDRKSELKTSKKGIRLPGKKRAKETQYFFNNARMLARIAKDEERTLNDEVVAVLFRDSDTASAGRGDWEGKRQSMLNGFEAEGFTRGVPMMPKPTSEAWLLCALQQHPYQNCADIENRTGSSRSPHSLKNELAMRLGQPVSAEELCDIIAKRKIDIKKIDMPSFAAFRHRLEEVI